MLNCSDTITIYNFHKKDNNFEIYRTVVKNSLIKQIDQIHYAKTGIKTEEKAEIKITEVDKYKDEYSWGKLLDKSQFFTLQKNGFDLVVDGDCSLEITSNSIEEDIAVIEQYYRVYKINTYKERLKGSKHLQHIQVGVI